jgi:hypothetical protein
VALITKPGRIHQPGRKRVERAAAPTPKF